MDSSLLKRVIGLLSTAEEALQKVIAETAAGGEYGTARSTAEAAEGVRRVRSQLQVGLTSEVQSTPQSTSESRKERKTGEPPKREPPPQKPKPKTIYPRFEVRQGTLYRYGWSKREKREYVHKVPQNMFTRTVAGLEALGNSGSGPHMADVLLESMQKDEDPAPSYQVYVVLGLLKDAKCIQQVGREGYVIPKDIVTNAEKVWADLSANEG